jgi:hypothetical protein
MMVDMDGGNPFGLQRILLLLTLIEKDPEKYCSVG